MGKPFWETPWFTGTPGMREIVRDAVRSAASGKKVPLNIDFLATDVMELFRESDSR